MAAAQVQTVKIDDVMEFFATYVSEWDPNEDDADRVPPRQHRETRRPNLRPKRGKDRGTRNP